MSFKTFFAASVGLALLMFADAASAAVVCDVHDFGAKGDGAALDTKAIQGAIDSCAKTGGTVFFGPGRYVSGTLFLKSHITLKLDQGAILSGSHDVKDYLPSPSIGLARDYGTNIAGEGMLTGLIVAMDVTDVAIEGPGIIDGQNDAFMSSTIHAPLDYDPTMVRNPKAFAAAMQNRDFGPFETVPSGRPGVLILFLRARDVTLHGFKLRASPNWTLVFQDADRVTISDFSIINNPLMPNNDGIDCMKCHDVHISNGTIRTGDDDVVLVNSDDVTVDGLSMYSRSAAVRLESTHRAVLNNLTIDSNRGLAIFASRQIARGTDGVLFSNIVMHTQLMPGQWWGKAEPIYISVQPCDGPCGEPVRNVTFSNIEADAEAGVMISGAPGRPVEGLELRDVRLRMVAPAPSIADALGGNFDSRWTAEAPRDGVIKHDIPAIYCRNADATTIRNVEVTWAKGMPGYATAAVACENFDGLTIDGLSETGDAPKGSASLQMSHGKGLVTDRLRLARPIKRKRP